MLFRWERHHQTSLDKIMKELCLGQIIFYYDPDPATMTILQCEANWVRSFD